MEKLDFNKIHMFELFELRILLDINSGTVHVIDKITWDFIDQLQVVDGRWEETKKKLLLSYKLENLEEVAEEIKHLIRSNLLFTEQFDLGEYEQLTSQQVVKAMCLHVAHDCNLRCGYCFAETGSFSGQRSLMDLDTGKKAIDFLLANSGNRRNVEVDFFGGEPLLNFNVVKELVSYGQEKAKENNKNLKFTLTTNGVLLNEEVGTFLDENHIDVVLSLDGRPEVNDKMRPFAGGRGSYSIIKDAIFNFVQKREQKNYYVRGTFTRHNLDFSEDVKHLVELGFTELSLEPVVAQSGMDYGFLEEDLGYLKEQYEKLTQYYWERYENGQGFNFFHFNIDLNHGPCLPKRLSGCGAGHEYLAVSPEGDLYPCHQFVGQENHKIGHIESGINKPEVGPKFKNSHVLKKEECKVCWARFHCSGGCHANNLSFRGSLLKPYTLGCELQKKRMECALYLQIKKAE